MSGESVGGTDQIETAIGSMVIETPRRVSNPTTDKYQDLTNLKEDGYCRQFLALYSHHSRVNTIDLDSAPMLSFDKDRWELEELDGSYLLVKREPESKLGQMLEGNDHSVDTETDRSDPNA